MNNNTYHLIDSAQVKEALQIDNVCAVPRLTAAVVNIGVGKLEKERRDKVAALLAQITGRKPVATLARKSIAGFKLRAGNLVGYKVTLRGETLRRFVYKLVNVVLPRTRDFQGLKLSSVTREGALNLGLKDISIFPEVKPDDSAALSLQVCLTSTARGDNVESFYRLLGFPLEKK